jgi:ribose transport system substrate-binding protein
MSPRTRRPNGALLVALLAAALFAVVAAGCGSDSSSSSATKSSSGGSTGASAGKKYTIGVSNTLVGNGWREEMICAVKAQSLASGKVSKVLISNQNGGAPEQIAAIRNLISSGANAIIINPADPKALSPVIAEAKRRGVVVVSVDSAVESPDAYNVTNDQVAYGRLGGDALAKQINGKGNVVEMRGIKGVPADTDRHQGFMEALKKYPGVKVVKETFTGWQFNTGGKQALDILQGNQKVDGFWTSGIDYTVVNAFKTANKTPVPVIGADNNAFLANLLGGSPGAAVTNPAAIGGVGTTIALDALQGKNPDKKTILTPQVWESGNKADWEKYYNKSLPPTYSNQLEVKPYTTYTTDQLTKCQGP